MNRPDSNIQTMLGVFAAVEHRDQERMLDLCAPDVEFHWPKSLPYGREVGTLTSRGPGWGETWAPLQPTEAERRLDPRVIAASDTEVVVHWTQRGLSPSGERFEGEVLGLYRLRDGKLARAQMFYFDTVAVVQFLERAARGGPPQSAGRAKRPGEAG
ncbi:MAG TPA: nuclear transport factor 2 family protein [Terriglobales bacterium]|nr:nuclear transport factor 2 family protein [Terriglobales bacterium]